MHPRVFFRAPINCHRRHTGRGEWRGGAGRPGALFLILQLLVTSLLVLFLLLSLFMPAEPPYKIVRVTELIDVNGRMQGEPGYNNALVLPGDVLRGINGTDVNSLPVGGVRLHICPFQ